MALNRGRRRRLPVWAVLCMVFGGLLVLGSGGALVAGNLLQARYSIEERDLFGGGGGAEAEPERYGEDITGPLNLLLVGVDTRPSRPDEPPRADAIIVVHIPESMDRGYFVSLPRDTLVDIPAFPETGYPGGQDRLNSAMYFGSRQVDGEEQPDYPRGFQLLATTVAELTGIEFFDAGAVIRFEGFVDVVDAMDGITVELSEEIVSEHREPGGRHRELGCGSYCGPQMVYQAQAPPCGAADPDSGAFTCDLEGWQALDVARQRYGVTGMDYGRQRNQQVILEAIMEKAFSRDVVTNPIAIDRVVRAGGDALMFDGRGRQPIDFAFALRDVRPGSIVSLTLPAANLGTGDGYQGEQLEPEAYELFEALNQGELAEFVLTHPDLVS